jgi:DNA-binding NarL/FixJ family response regulator
LLALNDLDQARILLRSGSSDLSRINALLEASTNMSRTLGMIGWERFARELRERLSKGSYPGGLTEREAEILTHLASGRTNKEIATDLFISVATVERHVANIYRKIGVRSRVEATAFALSGGLTASLGVTRT